MLKFKDYIMPILVAQLLELFDEKKLQVAPGMFLVAID